MSFLCKLNLQFFAEESPVNNEPPEGGDQPSNPTAGGEQATPSSTQTAQPSADEIKASILKELGVDSVDAAKQSLTAFKQYQDSQKTETQKLQDQLAESQKQLDAAKSAQTISDAKIAALGKGVRADAVDDVIKMVNGAEDIGKAIDEVLKKYPVFGGQQEPPATPGHPSFGQNHYAGDKPPDTLTQQFLKAFGINNSQK